MKLNFWQWLGVALLVVGVIVWMMRERRDAPNSSPAPKAPMATQPATQ